MSAYNAVNAALYSKLTGGTALTALLTNGSAIYYQQAPDYASMPYVVFNVQGGGADNTHPNDVRSMVYYVRGYATTPAVAGSVDAQISALLHRKSISASGWVNFWLAREEDLATVQVLPSGERIYSAGATYRIRITQ